MPSTETGDGQHTAVTAPTLHLEVEGISYAYRKLGPATPEDATPLVFLQRFRGTLDDWDPAFVDAMASTRTVVLFSDAAVGSSGGRPARTVDEKSDNAAAFIRALGFSRADVLGFSMGGFVAQAIAIREPDLVRKVVLVGTGPGGNPETEPHTDIVFEIAAHQVYDFEDTRYLFFSEGRDVETRESMERIASRVSREPAVRAESDVTQAMVDLIFAFMSGESGHHKLLGRLRQPTLIISGDNDPFFPVKNQWLLHREISDARLAVYPLAGHAPHHQHPQAVAEQVRSFLDAAHG
ncbi:peroxidase [Streptomyces sulfonofaciens]|uniref:Peroxidase n=1 Tax=Streptomyces sulfonofaciens TaxID=68272 RepID=A0A919L4W0_9ACTN|nr:alpha/beta hydrolase [Streptomyces sulfonofaciens]GHH82796.1 peroxidase [Streptomyces sulfonofaciens]